MSSKNILGGGGHLLETSSSGARKFWRNRLRCRIVTPASVPQERLPAPYPPPHCFYFRLPLPSPPRNRSSSRRNESRRHHSNSRRCSYSGTSTSSAETNPSISTYASDPSASINLPPPLTLLMYYPLQQVLPLPLLLTSPLLHLVVVVIVSTSTLLMVIIVLFPLTLITLLQSLPPSLLPN